MRILLSFVCFLLLISIDSIAGLNKIKLNHNGIKRNCYVYFPDGLDKNKPIPLVIAMHPGGTNSKMMIKYTGMNAVADKEKFIVAYPEAYEKYWNDGREYEGIKSQKLQIDDVGFISELIDNFISDKNVDPKRVYITGASSGAMMCYRLACELTNRITALAPILATMPENLIYRCLPRSNISVMILLSEKDPIVPWKGGDIKFGRKYLGRCVSASTNLKFWTTLNSCSEEPLSEATTNTDASGKTTIVKENFLDCEKNTKVVFYALKNSGHGWPGGKPYLSPRIAGNPPIGFNASEMIWNFFKECDSLN
jgi:polyhydroxybutyrate depolymerase